MASGAKCAVPSSQDAASPAAAATAFRAAAPTLEPSSALPSPLLIPKNPPLLAIRALYLGGGGGRFGGSNKRRRRRKEDEAKVDTYSEYMLRHG